MKEMSDREAEYLDNYFTEHTIMPDMTNPGYFARKYGMTIILDSKTTQVLSDYAGKVHKTPSEIIGELVRKELISASA